MRSFAAPRRAMLGALLVALLAWLPAGAQPEPLAVMSIQSVDGVLNRLRYLGKLAGQDDVIDQVDGILKAQLGDGGFKGAGIDDQKPLGAVVLMPSGGLTPGVIGLIPITSEKDFVGTLERFNITLENGEGGTRYLQTPDGQKLYVKFADGYALASNDASALGRLANPAAALERVARASFVAAQVNLNVIPNGFKDLAVMQIDQQLDKEKNKREGESEAEFQGRQAGMKLARNAFVSLIKDSSTISLHADVNPTQHRFHVDLDLAAKSGTTLATQMNAFGQARSKFAGMGSNAAASFCFQLPLPKEIRDGFGQLVDKVFQEALDKEKSIVKKAVAEKVFKVLEPTLKADTIDVAVAMPGPLDDGKFGLVFAMQVKDGKTIEQLVKDFINEAPEKDRKNVQLDLPGVGEVKLHKITPDEKPDQTAERVFGGNDVWVAFRNDAVFAALGKHGGEQIKRAVGSLNQPTSGPTPPMLAQARLKGLATLEQDNPERVGKAAKDAFAESGQDVVQLSLQGGESLRLHFEMHTHVLKFVMKASPAGDN